MTPEIALVILLTIVALRPFWEMRDLSARVEALNKGGYKPDALQGCLLFLLLPVGLGLWWYYALATDQILLGVIPSVGTAMTLIAKGLETFLRRA
jgi:hypothetical protein